MAQRRIYKESRRIAITAIRTILIIAIMLVDTAAVKAATPLIKFNFTGIITSTFGVSNAGTQVSGFIIFDSSVPSDFVGCNGGCASYPQTAPAQFYFSTNGGFQLAQTITSINIADKFANGISDYYVWDADVGIFSASTTFSRLELSLSNNSNPIIPNISIPTTPPNPMDFQFHVVGFFEFDGFTPTKRVLATITSLTSAPLFAGTPGKANCIGQSISALAKQYGGLARSAATLDYSNVSDLQNAVVAYCGG